MIRPFLIVVLLLVAAPLRAEERLPLWELGAGAFALHAPDYPAAGQGALNGLPYGYLIYRGDRLRIGDGAPARIIPFRTDRLELDLSADAAFGAESDGNALRAGMPDLDPLFELGPQVILRLAQQELPGGTGQFRLALQARGVFSAGSGGIDYQGAVFKTDLQYRRTGLFGPRSYLRASIGPIFASEGVQDYFYEVAPGFATPARPEFDAQSGYLGTEASVSLAYPLSDRLRLWGGVGIGVWSGARNRGSALHARDVTGQAYLGFSYTLARSDRMVPR